MQSMGQVRSLNTYKPKVDSDFKPENLRSRLLWNKSGLETLCSILSKRGCLAEILSAHVELIDFVLDSEDKRIQFLKSLNPSVYSTTKEQILSLSRDKLGQCAALKIVTFLSRIPDSHQTRSTIYNAFKLCQSKPLETSRYSQTLSNRKKIQPPALTNMLSTEKSTRSFHPMNELKKVLLNNNRDLRDILTVNNVLLSSLFDTPEKISRFLVCLDQCGYVVIATEAETVLAESFGDPTTNLIDFLTRDEDTSQKRSFILQALEMSML